MEPESALCAVPRESQRPNALGFSPFAQVSLEVVFEILDYLPPEAAQGFALTCRQFYFALGTQPLKKAQIGEVMGCQSKFLYFLERDCPDHIYCYYCSKLHSMDKAHWHTPSLRAKAGKGTPDTIHAYGSPSCLQANCENYFYLHPNFTFVVFQMAMKRYRQGRDCSTLLQLLSYPTITGWIHECFQQSAHEVRISKKGKLIYRQQQRFKLPRDASISIPWAVCARVCPHFSLASMESFKLNKATLRLPDGKIEGNLIQCRSCRTEFRVDHVKYGLSATVFFITKWLDLGEGRTPNEDAWRNHVLDSIYRLRPGRIKFPRGSIFRAFEREEPFRFKPQDLFTGEDKKALHIHD
jgi:hypothetical protein